jgi:hypothetical protein
MREFDSDGRLLCKIQASIFEDSLKIPGSSAIFIRRFMNSAVAGSMDDKSYLNLSSNIETVFEDLNREYGETEYGKIKYSSNELNWIGYLYRYWAYVFEWPSSKIFKTVNGREMHSIYLAYHSLDPEQAIARIAESKGIDISAADNTDRIKEGVEILKRLKCQTGVKK